MPLLEEIVPEAIRQFGAMAVGMLALYYWNRWLRKQIKRLRKERNEWKNRCLNKHEETMAEYEEQSDLMDELFQELKRKQKGS